MKTIVRSQLKYQYGGTAVSFFKLSTQSLEGQNYALTSGKTGDGVKMTIPSGNPNELDDSMIWAFIDEDNSGWSKVKNIFTGPLVALQAGGLGEGVSMQPDNDSDEQKWKVMFTNGGPIIIFNKATANQGYVLDSNTPDGGQNTNLGFPGPLINNRASNGNATPSELWTLSTVGATDALYDRIFSNDPCGVVAHDATPGSTNGTCGAVAGSSGLCGAVAGGAGACGIVGGGAAACGAVAKGVGGCGAVASGIGACGAVAGGVGTCGAVAGGQGACGLVANGAGACGIVVSGVGGCGAAACGIVAAGAAGCGAVATGVGLCGAVAKGTGACGAVENGVAFCPAAVRGEGACGADVGTAEGVGACGAQIGFCGLVACVALPVGGNW